MTRARGWLGGWFLAWAALWTCCSGAQAQPQKDPPTNPAFRQNSIVWISAQETGREEIGTEDTPFVIGRNGITFDHFMSRFRGVVNVTFLLKPGVYLTRGVYEVLPGAKPSGDYWEPADGWRMIGAGTNETFIVMEGTRETRPTKHQVIGNSITGKLARHVEIAHLTIQANGRLHAQTQDSNFGCIYITGSFVNLHDILCLGGFNALSPNAANALVDRELFILGVGGKDGFQVTNNVIQRAVVVLDPTSPKMFSGAKEGLTSAIINAANAGGLDVNNRDDLTYSPRILGCDVVGANPVRRVNGITIFGGVGGLAASNRVMNVGFSFYTDDGPFSDSVHIANNLFSNAVYGVYFNYNTNTVTYRWHQILIQSNTIHLNPDFGTAPTRFTAGINLFGAAAQMPFANLSNVVISHNNIIGTRGGVGANQRDFGVILTGCRNALIYSNRIELQRNLNALLVSPGTERGEVYQYCLNRGWDGSELTAVNRYASPCETDPQLQSPPCAFPSSCPVGDPFSGPFQFAKTYPQVRPNPSGPQPGLSFIWEAEEGDVIPPAVIQDDPDATGGKSVTSSVEDAGGVRFTFYLPLPRTFNMYCWARVHPSDQGFTGFFDVEVDSDRRFFGLDNDVDFLDFAHYVVTDRIPVANTNRVRALSLTPGWHTITFWARNPGVRLDEIFLTTSLEQDYRPNAALVKKLRFEGKGGTLIANECAWTESIEAERARLTSPLRPVIDSPATKGSAIRSLVADRGDATFRMFLPKTGNYQIEVRMRPATDTGSDTAALLIDGPVSNIACEPSPDYQWSSRIGNSETQARTASATSGIHRFSSGWHTFVLRTRHPGVLIDVLRLTALP